jgi:long-subunit fatty acid transport protein
MSAADNSVSYERFGTTIKPSAALYFAAYADPKPIQAGLTVRLPNRYKVDIDTTANARLLGPTNNITLMFNSASAIYYDPLEVDAAFAYQFDERTWVTLELDWFRYKSFENPVLTVTNQGGGGIHNSVDTLPSMQNIYVPKVGFERKVDVVKVRAGYGYRPSPITDNSGPGNIVDPEKHVFTAGAGVDLKEAKITEKSISLDLDLQYHYLVSQHITKSPGNELGISGQSKVGSPGYDIGGHLIGGGLSVTANF